MRGEMTGRGHDAPQTVDAFHQRLAERMDGLPRRMRDCAAYIAVHSDRIAVSTVADVAAGAGVPASAVMRFCKILGFSGFSDMQRLFREAFVPGFPDYATRLRNLKLQGDGSPGALLAEFVEAGRLSLESLANSVDDAALRASVDLLAKAQLVHVIGLRRAFPVASYIVYALEKLSVPAMLHDGVGLLEHRLALRSQDAVLAISFAPYSGETVALAQRARSIGVPVVALTDHLSSPLVEIADAVLTVQEVDFGAFRSLSATLVLAISLAVAIGAARQ